MSLGERMGLRISTILLVSMLLFSFYTSAGSADDPISHPNDLGDLWENLSLKYTFSFSEPHADERVANNNIYSVITMDECITGGDEAGEPAMPVKFIKLLLPHGTKVKDINVVGVPIEFDTTYMNLLDKPIFPYQDPVPIGDESPKEFAFDSDIYDSLNAYPAKLLDKINVGYCRGYAILSLALNPVRYVPFEGRLLYYPKMLVDIKLEKNDSPNPFFRNNQEDLEWVKKLVSNPELIGSYSLDYLPPLEYAGGLCNPADIYEYVIITTTQNGLDDWGTNSSVPFNWTSLIDKHTLDDNLNCTLVTMEEINACSDYWNSTALFNDTAAHIREFCKDAYEDWGTQYIFVGGDDEWIPAREMDYSYESDVDSDLYWSNLDDTFNDDSDTDWGEEGDTGFDLYSELYIGRITCDTPQDVSNWMNKSFSYADSPLTDYLENAAFYGGDTGWSCQGDDFIDYSAIKGTNDWLGPDPDSDGPYPNWLGFQYGFETWNSENPLVEFNLSEKWTAEPPNSGWQGGSESAAINGLKNAINNDEVTLISVIAHANENYSMDVYYTNWESDYHNTKPFFVHDYGCHCGDMDAANDGVLHSMLFHSDTELAFGCVYNTCYGWGNYYSTNSSSSLQQKCFWDYFFDTTNNSGSTLNWQLGKAMAFSKDTMAPTIDWDPLYGTWRAILQGCLLFGDPAQKIKPPAVLDHNVGVQTIDLSVPDFSKSNELIYVNATVYNSGDNNESSVSVRFLLDDSLINTTNISSFESQTSQQVSFNFTPSAGAYTVTINITIANITEEYYIDNEKNETIAVGVLNTDTEELFDTIQGAINDADTKDNHTINVPGGLYYENVTISKNISLIGANQESTIIECNEIDKNVISIQNRNYVNVSNFTLSNGNYGVIIENSSNVIFSYNQIDDNSIIGVSINTSNNVTVTDNEIMGNPIGLVLVNSSDNNTLINNDILSGNIGLVAESGSDYNSIYHNNFNNTQNAFDNGSFNSWDNGNDESYRMRGGNWWSNYTGEDINGDGIGETPYNISGLNYSQDRYPLIETWTGYLSGNIYVDDDNVVGPWYGTEADPYRYIQDAIDNAISGDSIFVYNGTYSENIVVDKSVDLVGADRNFTIIDAGGAGDVVYIDADWVNLTGFNINNSGVSSVSIDWANFSLDYLENNIDGYCAGIKVSSNNNAIYGNNITNNFFGILWLEELFYNNISDNRIANVDYDGICIGYSSYNFILNNVLSNIYSSGIDLGYSSDTNVFGNTVNGYGSFAGIETWGSSNINVSDNTVTESYLGIYSKYSSNNEIMFNDISDSDLCGVYLSDSYTNTITKNNFTNNYYGIYGDSWSENNIIFNNNFIDNLLNAYDSGTNFWYNTTILSGNYWNDFDTPGEGAYDNNDDGIVDTPYDNIGGGSSQDSYPLTGRWDQRPCQPTCIQPVDGATGCSVSLTLSVRATDPNSDSMDVRFYSLGGALIDLDAGVSDGGNAVVTWSSLSYSTTYNWYAVADDGAYLTKSDTWSFTTENGGGGGFTPGSGPSGDTTSPTTPTNVICTTPESDNTPSFSWDASTDASGISGYYVKIDNGANTFIGNVTTWTSTAAVSVGTHTFYVKAKDASTNANNGSYGSCTFIINTALIGNPPIADANGPYDGLTYENVTFDGSGSHDNGTIENYTWDFGDGVFGYTVKSTHSYISSGLFNVILTVTDNDGLSNISRTTANITLDSDGDGWSDLEEDKYNTNKANSSDYPIDLDGDRRPDDFDDDDDNDGLLDHLETTLHSDPSDSLDVIQFEIAGNRYYLIDLNKDGLSDELYNPVGGTTTVGFTEDGRYLIDTDGDKKWNYIYDPASKDITVYIEKKSPEEFPWIFVVFGLIGAVILVAIVLYLSGYRIWVEKPPNE